MPYSKTLRLLPKKGVHLWLQPAQAWIAILWLVFFSLLCWLVHAGAILRLVFPVGSFVVGVLLYFRYPVLYLGFTWWLWFLTPWVRRLVDYQSGWNEPSIVLLSPLLVTLITLVTFVRNLPRSYSQGGLPFILCFFAVLYGFFVGLIKNSSTAAVLNLLQWLTPILLGFHLFANWRNYPSYRQNMERTFLWGVLLMGSYGVLQYLVAPEWDRFWMMNAEINSIGTPEPLGIRVFSTMNAPQPFAGVIMAGLLLLFSRSGGLVFPAAGAGYLAFLLSSARSAWLSWFVGLLLLIPSTKARIQMRIIVSIIVIVMLVFPLVTVEPFSTVIGPRLQSLSNVNDDGSLKERSEGYGELLSLAISEVLGEGLGNKVGSDSVIGGNDSTILPTLFSLGWFGTIPYVSGMLLIFCSVFQGANERSDPFRAAARAIALGTFSQLGLNMVIIGPIGIVLWGFLGMDMAARKYYCVQRAAGLEESFIAK